MTLPPTATGETDDYMLAGKGMNGLVVAISTLGGSISAVSLLGGSSHGR